MVSIMLDGKGQAVQQEMVNAILRMNSLKRN